MNQNPTEMRQEWEDGDTGAPADFPGERESDAAGATENTAIGREWTGFAGKNEYERNLSVLEWDTPSGSAVGCEWQDFAGTNEYRADVDAGR